MKNDILNPPDLAIALQYDGDNAPRVTAKGRGILAEDIIRIAEDNNIPLHPNGELGAILANVPLGEEIPDNLYRAVAEVIAFAYMLSGRIPDNFKPPTS